MAEVGIKLCLELHTAAQGQESHQQVFVQSLHQNQKRRNGRFIVQDGQKRPTKPLQIQEKKEKQATQKFEQAGIFFISRRGMRISRLGMDISRRGMHVSRREMKKSSGHTSL